MNQQDIFRISELLRQANETLKAMQRTLEDLAGKIGNPNLQNANMSQYLPQYQHYSNPQNQLAGQRTCEQQISPANSHQLANNAQNQHQRGAVQQSSPPDMKLPPAEPLEQLPDYAKNIAECFAIIDKHDYNPGNGVSTQGSSPDAQPAMDTQANANRSEAKEQWNHQGCQYNKKL